MQPRYIFLHHTGVSYEKNPDQWKATDAYHKNKGWGGGGYNAEASKMGKIHTFREDGTGTAAQYVAKEGPRFSKKMDLNNGTALSLCLDGNFDIEEPTVMQCQAAYEWITHRMGLYGIPRENVMPHRAVSPKSCWGKLLPDDVLGYLESRLNRIPDWGIESVEKAKARGITDWSNPNEEMSPQLLEEVMFDLGLRTQKRGTISKIEFIHCLDKAHIL
jgi:N-acetylmuramoyl-L-alanine amidase